MIKKGDYLVIKPEWRDAGDEAFTWVARSDEQSGQVDISAVELAHLTTVASADCARRHGRAPLGGSRRPQGTRARLRILRIQDWPRLTHTTRYTALSQTRFKDFWRD